MSRTNTHHLPPQDPVTETHYTCLEAAAAAAQDGERTLSISAALTSCCLRTITQVTFWSPELNINATYGEPWPLAECPVMLC
jgi:hypothetical protein